MKVIVSKLGEEAKKEFDNIKCVFPHVELWQISPEEDALLIITTEDFECKSLKPQSANQSNLYINKLMVERVLFWYNDERYLVKDIDGLVEKYKRKGQLRNVIWDIETHIERLEALQSLIEDDLVQQVDEGKEIPKEEVINDLGKRIEDTRKFSELLKSKLK